MIRDPMRPSFRLARALAWLVLGFAFGVPAAAAPTDDCADQSQAGLRSCLEARRTAAAAALDAALRERDAALAHWDEEPRYVATARKQAATAQAAYVRWRDAQCAYERALGGGAVGNALALRQLACLIELDEAQAQRVKAKAPPGP